MASRAAATGRREMIFDFSAMACRIGRSNLSGCRFCLGSHLNERPRVVRVLT